ncbi:MAG: alpha/beta hydrolase [Desulfarculaceae bacterium]
MRPWSACNEGFHWLRSRGRLFVLGAMVLSLMGAGCDRFIESQIFFPERELAAAPDSAGLVYSDHWIETADGQRLHAWWLPAAHADTVLLFCHGNAGNISHRLENLVLLNRLGLGVLIFDYRGYGQSSGSASEAGFYLDAEAAGRAARALATGEGARLVVFGRSLGGIAAVHLCSQMKVEGLILESTFTHLGDMARSLLPLPGLSGWLHKRFNALEKIPGIKAPLLFFHGDEDEVVPYTLGRTLFEAANQPKEFVTLAGAGHNNTYIIGGQDYFQRIQDFVKGLPAPEESGEP